MPDLREQSRTARGLPWAEAYRQRRLLPPRWLCFVAGLVAGLLLTIAL